MPKIQKTKTIGFLPATWNLAETTRTIQVAKACIQDFNIEFASYGGQFEELITKEGFSLTRLSPRLSKAQIEHMYKVDQGEKIGTFFSLKDTRERVQSEISFIKKMRPFILVTGFNVTVSISSQVVNIPLVWLTQSTWDFNTIMDQGLGSYIDDLDRPILRWLPENTLKWLTKKANSLIALIAFKPFNKVANEYGLKPFREVQDLWTGFYNLMAEPEDFSGLKNISKTAKYIGPLIADLDVPIPKCVQVLVKNPDPIVYFAMGSSGRPQLIKRIIEGFRNQPFKVISPMLSKLKDIQVDVPKNVLLTDWLPALQVSRLADISVIHGGIGTVMTAALAGKPVVGVGMMPEQEYNIDCLVRKGFAKRIRRTRLKPKLVNEAVLHLLNDHKAKQKATDYAKHVQYSLNQRDLKIREFFISLNLNHF